MTTSFPVTKTGRRQSFASAALTGCLALALLSGPGRAEDANPVLAKVNGAEDATVARALAREVGGAGLGQRAPAAREDNGVSLLNDRNDVAKAAEEKKGRDRGE